MLLRETFAVGPFASNCTVLACADTKEGVVIDPGGGPNHIREVVDMYDITVKAIIHTHAHLDHVYSTKEVKDTYDVDICLHKADRAVYESAPAGALMFGLRPFDLAPVDRFFEEGDAIPFGKREARVVHTPGHTPGSVCFVVEDDDAGTIVFSGDTLFCRGIGRTDMPGGNTRQLYDSIRTKLYTMEPTTLVIPGHGENTTIGEEMKMNPFVTV